MDAVCGWTQLTWYAGRRCGRSPGGSGDGAVVADVMAGLGYRMREGVSGAGARGGGLGVWDPQWSGGRLREVEWLAHIVAYVW